MHHLAMIICHVKLKYAMRIGPKPLCDRPFERNFVLRVIRRVAVVGGQRKRKNGNTHQGKKNKELAFQGSPPLNEYRTSIVRLDPADP